MRIFPVCQGGCQPRNLFTVIGVLWLLSSFGVMAQEKPLWELGMGVAVGSFPSYRGAAAQYQYMAPLPYLVYRGERVTLDREGLRGLLFESERWHLDLSVDGAVPAKSNGGPREGMVDLKPVIEVGPSLEYVLYKKPDSELRLRMPLRLVKDIPTLANRGVTFHPNLALTLQSGGWEWGGSAGPLFASRSYHDYYYSVAAGDETPTRPAYVAGEGYSGVRLTMGASRRFRQFWFGGFLRVDDLHGAVFADSPLVERGDAVMAGFVLSWVFKQSERRVQAP